MRMDPGVDTGPILSQRSLFILPEDTSRSLSLRLADLGAELLIETLPGYLDGLIVPRLQNEAKATYAPILKKEDGKLDFNQPAENLTRRVRAFNPWPGAFTDWQDGIMKILRTRAVDIAAAYPGRRLVYQGLPAIGTAQGLLVLDEVQPAGKKPMPGKVFLHGARGWGQ
jgi:methionyl-tRNA formyltransferase